jgi:CDP-diglyceride synthetase
MTETVKPPDSSFRLRVKSALVFVPAVLIVLYIGGPLFAIMMAAGAGIGAWEWSRMVMTGQNPPRYLAHLAAVLTALGTITAGMVESPIPSFLFLLALCFVIFAYNFSKKGPNPKELLFGARSFCARVSPRRWRG